MKKLLFIAFTLIIPFFLQAQNAKYQKAMGQALTEMKSAKDAESLQKLANDFGRIAQAETTEWLPAYYQSLSYMQLSLLAMSENPSKLGALLEEAQKALDQAMDISPNNSELLTLQGYIYIGHIWMDPMTNGAKYSPIVGSTLATAMELDPNNPRPYYLQAMNIYFTPEFYGGGANKALPIFEKAESLFESFELASPFHPQWGADGNAEMLAQIRG
ncbi:MAG: hypothetical protein KDC34_06880 [Saprospiraceae bacterium]|nr:hypothetical protein [Saprospiraceae bacterium]